MAEAGERTEKATPKRRHEARNRGQVARSQEINSTAVLAAGLALTLLASGHLSRVLGINAAYLFAQAHVLRADNPDGMTTLLAENLRVMLIAVAPILLAVFVAGLVANVAQVGLRLSPEALNLKLNNLNPVTGAKRFFQKRALFEAIKNVFKIGLIAWLAAGVLRSLEGDLATSGLLSTMGVVSLGKAALSKLASRLLLLLAALALLDWVFQKWQYEQNLKMSRTETKQEYKDLEGDPQIKARVRHIQLETARRRMLAAVPQADVVVTNPDHFAVALQYGAGQAAPRVVAKGRNHLAETIKRIARQSRVPVLENRPLAQALYRRVKVGAFIPENLYQAVAEVLAYVYRLRKA